VYYHFKQFCRTGLWTRLYRALRDAERRRVGKDPDPSAAIIDAQSVKTVEESARIRGFDAHKHVKGRKRHILVDPRRSSSTRSACRFRSTSRRPTCTTHQVLVGCWPD
jgi:hypothetical protein